MQGNRVMFLIRLLLLGAVVSGCSVSSLTHSHPERMTPILADYFSDEATNVETAFGPSVFGRSKLDKLEYARLAQVDGGYPISKETFEEVIADLKKDDEAAIVRVSEGVENAAAILVNDTVIEYKPAGYERVFLHHSQALNYLAGDDLDGAGVEARVANDLQRSLAEAHEDEIEEVKESVKEDIASITKAQQVVNKAYAGLNEAAGLVKSSFQSAYSFYLSAVIHESQGDLNNAYVSYKKALEIAPANKYLKKDVFRLAKKLAMTEDVADLKRRFSGASDSKSGSSAKNGRLVVLYEEGFIPAKGELKIPVPLPQVGLVTVALPYYDIKPVTPNKLTVKNGNSKLGSTQKLCEFSGLAARALREQIYFIAARQVLRAAAKTGIQYAAKNASKKYSSLLFGSANVANFATENADLRSWLSLPNNAQILDLELKDGSYDLAFNVRRVSKTHTVKITPGVFSIVRVIRTGKHMTVQTIFEGS